MPRASAENGGRHPNVLLFFTDQQRWDTVGAHGNPLDLTPNFDRLARSGRLVSHSFTCQPVCGPARSVLQTGRYPTTTGCFRNDIPLPTDERTLAHHFAAAGYDTAYIGKWHLASDEPVPPEQRGGYDYWLASNILEFTSWPYDTVLYDGDMQPRRLPGYRVDALTDAAIRYLKGRRGAEAPFFLFLSFLEPHHQNQNDDYPAPVGYEERIRARCPPLAPDLAALGGSSDAHYPGYMGMVARLDEAFGRLVDALISLGRLEDTLILFTSDHGCHFKTRNDEYKRSCHEASIRVPTLFHGPGFRGGAPVGRLVSLIDLPPTLLDAAGLRVPQAMQGTSLLAEEGAAADDIFIQVSESQVGRALRTRRWKYGLVAPDADGSRDMGSLHYREAFLYDLDADPYELENLVGFPMFGGVREELRERLIVRMVTAGEPAPSVVPSSAAALGIDSPRPQGAGDWSR